MTVCTRVCARVFSCTCVSVCLYACMSVLIHRVFSPFIKYHCLSCQLSCPCGSLLHSWPISAHASCLMFISLVYLSVSSQYRCHKQNLFHVYFMPKQTFYHKRCASIFLLRSDKKATGYIRIERQMEPLDWGKGFESLFYYLPHSAASHTHRVCLQSVCVFDSQYVGCLHACLLQPASLGPYPFPPCVFMLVGICHAYGADGSAQWS